MSYDSLRPDETRTIHLCSSQSKSWNGPTSAQLTETMRVYHGRGSINVLLINVNNEDSTSATTPTYTGSKLKAFPQNASNLACSGGDYRGYFEGLFVYYAC